MSIDRNIIILGLISLTFAACEPSRDMPNNDARIVYLESNYPQLKNLRDQLVFQIKTSKKNVDQLNTLKSSFTQDASKEMVEKKISVIKQQQEQLINQLKRIDTEAERGIALKEFNTIDGGGERKSEIAALTNEAQQRVASATSLNNNIDVMYNGSSVITKTVSLPKHKRPTDVTLYEHYDELPAIHRDLLNNVFQKYPEMFDIEHKAGKEFIALVRRLKTNNPRFFKDPYWIDNAARTCTYYINE